MINEKTIEHLLDLLDEAVINFHEHTRPGSEWVENVNWLVFDLRRDLDLGRFMFDWMISPEEARELRRRNQLLEEENIKLENELDEAPDQDDLDELRNEVKDLEEQLSERDKLIDELAKTGMEDKGVRDRRWKARRA